MHSVDQPYASPDATAIGGPAREGMSMPLARKRSLKASSFLPYLYVAPFFVVFLVFFTYPLGNSFYVSLQKWVGIGPMTPVGWDNYTFLLQNEFFWSAVRTTALMWLMVIPAGTVLSLLIAVVWNQSRFIWRNIAIIMYLLPAVISVVAISVVFKILYDPVAGPLNIVLTGMGLPSIPWLSDEAWARIGIALVRLWESIGLGALFYFASIQAISQEIYDAAGVDGSGPIRTFWSITMPLLARTTLFLTVVNTLAVFSLFAEPLFVTNDGGPNNATTTIGLYLYHLVLNLDLGAASAVSFLMTCGMMVVSVTLFVVARRWTSD
jgi:ABC-type sugar transport system permease subunit